MKPTLNTKKPILSSNEKKQYKIDSFKTYYDKNSEKYKQKRKKWTQENSQFIECECGSKLKKYNLTEHLKTKKHQKYLDSLN
jgi:hypothetical protein